VVDAKATSITSKTALFGVTGRERDGCDRLIFNLFNYASNDLLPCSGTGDR
jgi:hypothetical protein